jgi:hypothetical protein
LVVDVRRTELVISTVHFESENQKGHQLGAKDVQRAFQGESKLCHVRKAK